MSHAPTASKLSLYLDLIRFDRPIGSLLLLWPTLWALWIAGDGKPVWSIVVVFVLGTFLMRSAGCAINDAADQDFDKAVARTAARPLARGLLSTREALAVGAVLALVALALVLAFLNRAALYWAFAAAALAVSYPFAKRFFVMPQAWLGIAFSMGIPMSFAAIQGSVPTTAWVLVLANFFWTIAYDTAYAMVDREDDRVIGIKTSAILFGRFDVVAIMLCNTLFLLSFAWLGTQMQLAWPFWLGLLVALALFAFHYQLIKGRERAGCFRAFLHNNWVGMAVFIGLFASYRAGA